ISPTTVALWAQVLGAVPHSRLIVKGYGLGEETTRQRWIKTFQAHEVDPARLELLAPARGFVDHLSLYSHIDIALETFPYHGTTTTCEALWMGVPVITLAGQVHVSRVGVSILANIGLPEWIVKDAQEYVQICATLAGDVPRLQSLRAAMRERFAS